MALAFLKYDENPELLHLAIDIMCCLWSNVEYKEGKPIVHFIKDSTRSTIMTDKLEEQIVRIFHETLDLAPEYVTSFESGETEEFYQRTAIMFRVFSAYLNVVANAEDYGTIFYYFCCLLFQCGYNLLLHGNLHGINMAIVRLCECIVSLEDDKVFGDRYVEALTCWKYVETYKIYSSVPLKQQDN